MSTTARGLVDIDDFMVESGDSSRDAAYRNVRQGHYPPGVVVRVGRRIRFDLDAWQKFKQHGGSGLSDGAGH